MFLLLMKIKFHPSNLGMLFRPNDLLTMKIIAEKRPPSSDPWKTKCFFFVRIVCCGIDFSVALATTISNDSRT